VDVVVDVNVIVNVIGGSGIVRPHAPAQAPGRGWEMDTMRGSE